jgi:hypothetical protein
MTVKCGVRSVMLCPYIKSIATFVISGISHRTVCRCKNRCSCGCCYIRAAVGFYYTRYWIRSCTEAWSYCSLNG